MAVPGSLERDAVTRGASLSDCLGSTSSIHGHSHGIPENRTDDDLAVKRPFAFAVLPQLGVGTGVKGSQAILPRHEDVGLPMMLNQVRRGMGGADGPILPYSSR